MLKQYFPIGKSLYARAEKWLETTRSRNIAWKDSSLLNWYPLKPKVARIGRRMPELRNRLRKLRRQGTWVRIPSGASTYPPLWHLGNWEWLIPLQAPEKPTSATS